MPEASRCLLPFPSEIRTVTPFNGGVMFFLADSPGTFQRSHSRPSLSRQRAALSSDPGCLTLRPFATEKASPGCRPAFLKAGTSSAQSYGTALLNVSDRDWAAVVRHRVTRPYFLSPLLNWLRKVPRPPAFIAETQPFLVCRTASLPF